MYICETLCNMTPAEFLELRKVRGARLKKVRLAAGISKLELSRRSGLARQTIDKIESGEEGWLIDSELVYLQYTKKTYAKRHNKPGAHAHPAGH